MLPPKILKWASTHQIVVGVIVSAVAIAHTVVLQAIGNSVERIIQNYGNQNHDPRTEQRSH